MIAWVAAIALLQQVADAPSVLVVRHGEREGFAAVVSTGVGPMIRAQEVIGPLGALLRQDGRDRFRLVLGDAEVELTLGIRFARVGSVTEPLVSSPTVRDGALFVPLSLFTDVLPRTIAGLQYDASRAELRRISGAVARARGAAETPGASGSASATSGRDAPAPPAGKAPPRPSPSAPPPSLSPKASEPRKERLVVVVDAGHGGRDRGMSGPIGTATKVHEADITLAVARQLRSALVAQGVDVVMTRTRDTLIALADRGRIANRARGDLFVSLHVNAANPRWRDPRSVRGFETYFLAEAKTDDERRVAEIENEAVKYEVEEGADGGDPLSFILADMKQNEYLRESSDLAESVQQGLARVHPAPNRGVKQAGFRVLVGAFMPAILVELGFGSSPADAAYLSSSAGQQALARALAASVTDYLSRYVTRRAAGAPSLP